MRFSSIFLPAIIGSVTISGCASVLATPPSKPSRGSSDEICLRVFENLQRNDVSRAVEDFDATMSRALPLTTFRDVWGQVVSEMGALRSFQIVKRATVDGMDGMVVSLEFERGKGEGQVVVDPSTGRISRFLIRPMEDISPSGSLGTRSKESALSGENRSLRDGGG